MVFVSLASLPWINYTFELEQEEFKAVFSLDMFLSILSLPRFYMVFKYGFGLFNTYNLIREVRLQQRSLSKYTYELKLAMSEQRMALTLTLSAYVIVIIPLSLAMQTFEVPFMQVSGHDWSNFATPLWCVFISMATIGYGDVSPTSYGGKLTIVPVFLCGIILAGVVFNIISKALKFDRDEQQVNQAIETDRNTYAKLNKAAKVITGLYKYR
jgi:hypothetical protein